MFILTITERTPTEPEGNDVNTYTVKLNNMFEVTELLEQRELSWTCWVNVNITYINE